jgi:hypothetical protein
MMKDRYKKHALGLARKLGVKIEADALPNEITVEAPAGYHWADGSGAHELVTARENEREPAESLWRDAAERMDHGLEPCCAGCEWWNESYNPNSQQSKPPTTTKGELV